MKEATFKTKQEKDKVHYPLKDLLTAKIAEHKRINEDLKVLTSQINDKENLSKDLVSFFLSFLEFLIFRAFAGFLVFVWGFRGFLRLVRQRGEISQESQEILQEGRNRGRAQVNFAIFRVFLSFKLQALDRPAEKGRHLAG